MPERATGIEVDQDLDFQRKDWIFERVGWIAMLLVIVAALLGLFGRGPLSDARLESSDGSLGVEYQRFERHGAPSELTLHVRRAAATDSTITVSVGEEFLRAVQVTQIVPQPARQIYLGDRTIFELEIRNDSGRVTFYTIPQAIGSRRLDVGVPGRAAIIVSQFVYP